MSVKETRLGERVRIGEQYQAEFVAKFRGVGYQEKPMKVVPMLSVAFLAGLAPALLLGGIGGVAVGLAAFARYAHVVGRPRREEIARRARLRAALAPMAAAICPESVEPVRRSGHFFKRTSLFAVTVVVGMLAGYSLIQNDSVASAVVNAESSVFRMGNGNAQACPLANQCAPAVASATASVSAPKL